MLLTEKDQCLAAFEALVKRNRKTPAWVLPIREAAISRFAELDFPTTQHEEWKYTNLAPVLTTSFKIACEGEGISRKLILQRLKPFMYGQPQWNRLVLVDGYLSDELSSLTHLPVGVKVAGLLEALATDSDLVRPNLARFVSFDHNPFHALNTALFQDGAFVCIPEGKVIEDPIHIIYVTTSQERNSIFQPRNLIIMGCESQAKVIESYVSLSKGIYFVNAVSEVVLHGGAVLDHYKIQDESEAAFHIATMRAHLERNSSFSSFSLATGSELSRYDLDIILADEGANCTLNGLYRVGGHQHVDHQTIINHAKPHGTSRQFYKGILDGKSRGVFNGKVIVQKGAVGTDAQQTNKNLLLSQKAHADTKPQLEIFCNDVKCTHGAAMGQLDEEALFYLKSRGMNEAVARNLLTYAFASDVIKRIQIDPIRQTLDQRFVSRFQKGKMFQEQGVVG